MALITVDDLSHRLPPGQTLAGLDLGTRTIGVAVADRSLLFAHPRPVLSRRKFSADAAALLALAEKEAVGAFVVGLPVNMDGSEGKAAKLCREFGARLAAHSQLPVEYADERLSSWEAEGMLIEGGLKPSERKQRVHAVAAKLILEAFFSARKAANEAGSGPSGEQAKE